MLSRILTEIFHWSEVWAMLIPLAIWAFYKTDRIGLRPVITFCWAGFFLYLLVDLSWKTKEHITLPAFLNDNNFLYNILSIFRVLFFSWYFIMLKQSILQNTKRILPLLFIVFAIFNFAGLENFKNFSNNIHVAEVIILMVFTISYFIYILRSDEVLLSRHSSFWIVTGMFIYEAVNLFVFVIYSSLSKVLPKFAFDLWYVHNIAQLIFCILLAKGFYESGKQRV